VYHSTLDWRVLNKKKEKKSMGVEAPQDRRFGDCEWDTGVRGDNLLVRSHFIIVMIRWTGLAPWEFE